MDEFNYRYNWEYAIKYKIPITEETRDVNVEIYDRYAGNMLLISNMSVQEIVSLISEVWASWRNITKKEYERLVDNG
jgi:hypothetical protein